MQICTKNVLIISLDVPVEEAALVMEGLPHLAHALLTGAKRTEVFACLRRRVSVQLEDNASSGLVVDVDVEEHGRVGHFARLW